MGPRVTEETCKNTRVVFMGTPAFACKSLSLLDERFNVVGVVTAPDAVRRRGNKLEPAPVAKLADELALNTYKTKRLDQVAQDWIFALKPDVICVVAFGAILPKEVLEFPRYGCINLHASLLPKWRGAAPIERAILAGDKQIGVTIMKMGEGLDDGPFSVQMSISIEENTQKALEAELSSFGACLLAKIVKESVADTVVWYPQPDSPTPYAQKLEKSEFLLSPKNPAERTFRQIQASSDSYPARMLVGDKMVRVHEAKRAPQHTPLPQGSVVFENENIYIGCGEDGGVLRLVEVQPEGKKPLYAPDWAHGWKEHTTTWDQY